LYAFQSSGLEGESQLHTSVEEMAAAYLALIFEVQAEGPYYLAGWSMGGAVAFEMARQLEERGEEVALLALFDSKIAPFGSRTQTVSEMSLLFSFARDLGLTDGWVGSEGVELTHLDPAEQLTRLLEQAKRANLLPPDITNAAALRLYQVFRNNAHALQRYAPRAYGGQVILFKAAESINGGSSDPLRSWDEVTNGGLKSFESPGDHYSMIREPHVRTLAALLNDCLDAVQPVCLSQS
jgi:thioesterase domain-containing protein